MQTVQPPLRPRGKNVQALLPHQGRPVRLGGRRQRAVLALLLLHANRRISRDRLIEDLWDGRPPPEAIQTLQSYVSRLRRLLGLEVQISARQGGYVITMPTAALDVERFRDLTERGHRALRSAQYDEASRVLREALCLWRANRSSTSTTSPSFAMPPADGTSFT
jgi:DNA-binding SARP family transcriptional activator